MVLSNFDKLVHFTFVDFRDGAIYRYRKTGKGVAGLLTRHSSSISFLVFSSVLLKQDTL